jgi:hypothetical protein
MECTQTLFRICTCKRYVFKFEHVQRNHKSKIEGAMLYISVLNSQQNYSQLL